MSATTSVMMSHPYFTRVTEGGFYGWPYRYIGPHVDDRVAPRPDLAAKAIAPDVLLGSYVAPLQFVFYKAQQFPSTYRHSAFVVEHGISGFPFPDRGQGKRERAMFANRAK